MKHLQLVDSEQDDNMTRWKIKLEHLFHKGSNNNDLTSVIETDYLGPVESRASTLSNKGVSYQVLDQNSEQAKHLTAFNEAFDAYEQEKTLEKYCQELNILLQNSLRQAKDRLIGKHIEVFLPKDLTERISRDIARMSECEPCGLRGCVIYTSLELRKGEKMKLCTVPFSEDTVSTFEVYLTLKEDKKRWYSLKDLILPVVSGCLTDPFQEEIFLSPGFQLVKQKLYRPNH